ncbi:hypothetical protein GCM10009602_13320 [Nocardiopsis tropica]
MSFPLTASGTVGGAFVVRGRCAEGVVGRASRPRAGGSVSGTDDGGGGAFRGAGRSPRCRPARADARKKYRTECFGNSLWPLSDRDPPAAEPAGSPARTQGSPHRGAGVDVAVAGRRPACGGRAAGGGAGARRPAPQGRPEALPRTGTRGRGGGPAVVRAPPREPGATAVIQTMLNAVAVNVAVHVG